MNPRTLCSCQSAAAASSFKVAPLSRLRRCKITDDFVPGRAAFAAAFSAGANLVFFDGLDAAAFFVDFDMVVSRVPEPTIGSPTTQGPRFAGCYHSSGWLWPDRIPPAQHQCVLCGRSPVANRKFCQQAKISGLQAHNLKVVSSNLAPATKKRPVISSGSRAFSFLVVGRFALALEHFEKGAPEVTHAHPES